MGDGWGASHVVLAAASLGAAPGDAYDPVRSTLLERCALGPQKDMGFVMDAVQKRGRGGLAERLSNTAVGTAKLHRLEEAERVAAALARLDVHDGEVRSRLAAWLLLPLPVSRFVALATDLARVGLGDAANPTVARHVRTRARSSDFSQEVDAE